MSKKLGLKVKYHHLSPKVILKMMEQGMRVEFPSGVAMIGEPETKYIVMKYYDGIGYSGMGQWNMSLDGVKSAINDARDYEISENNNSI